MSIDALPYNLGDQVKITCMNRDFSKERSAFIGSTGVITKVDNTPKLGLYQYILEACGSDSTDFSHWHFYHDELEFVKSAPIFEGKIGLGSYVKLSDLILRISGIRVLLELPDGSPYDHHYSDVARLTVLSAEEVFEWEKAEAEKEELRLYEEIDKARDKYYELKEKNKARFAEKPRSNNGLTNAV